MEKSSQYPKVSIGILNRGENNKFINNTFEGLDVGIQDEGENTLAEGNKFIDVGRDVKEFSTKHPWWFAIITGLILLLVAYVVKIIVGF
ncbi:MAG: hypothetical protein M1153_01155 [Patescibacteria group bacterium]|nr:hypothetical protein [Patescibacteria group bacterium]